MFGSKEIGRRTGNLPEQTIKVIQVVEAPHEVAAGRDQAQVFCRKLNVSIECGEGFSRSGTLINQRPEDIVDDFAQFFLGCGLWEKFAKQATGRGE